MAVPAPLSKREQRSKARKIYRGLVENEKRAPPESPACPNRRGTLRRPPGGAAPSPGATMSHVRLLASRLSVSWIQKSSCPGGIIPSLQAIDESLAQHTTLRVSHRRELGPHYAQTLKQWRTRFLDNWPQVQALGFDETFRRMWEFYLAYCEAGFRTGYLGVSQLQLTREPTWSATASSPS